ncbi:MAG: alpha/beta hydrolase [Chloroflexota bacterium]
MSVVFLDSAIVHYEVLGKGRPVFFLHGWVGSWKYWIPSLQVASTSYRAYALDLWGYGETARSPVGYSLDNQAEMLRAFLDKMGIGKIAIVGHGLGGLVAFNFAVHWSQNVDRIMAINCPADYDSVSARLRAGSPSDLADWLSNRTPEAAAALSDAAKSDPQAISGSMSSLQTNNLFGAMRNANVPCLFVFGQNDPAVPPPSPDKPMPLSHMMHQVVLDGSGHFPMMDETQKFNRLLIDFLALDSGASPTELQLKEEWKRRVR